MTAICPGSFDPITNGHIDLIRRTLRFADRVIVAICHNVYKQSRFTPDEREQLIWEALETAEGFTTESLEQIEIRVFSGLLADFFSECNADVIVRGVRSAVEYEHDIAQALANQRLNPRLETIFIPAEPSYAFLSSSIVKEIAAFGGDIYGMVPQCVADALYRTQDLP